MLTRHQGVRRHGNRWDVSVRVRGRLLHKTFPLDTPMSVLQNWRVAQRQTVRDGSGLSADVDRYLATVAHMPSLSDRTRHLKEWAAALGPERSRYAITTHEINVQLSRWLDAGRSPTTVKHLRTALRHFFRRLDPATPNPVDASQAPREPAPIPRYIPPDAIRRILSRLRRGSKTRARLAVMAYTGLPHSQVGALTAHSVGDGVLHVPARKKGHGAPGRALPLTPQARAALRLMARTEAWGAFSRSSLWKRFRAACRALGYPERWRPYDLRHSLATRVYLSTGDLATTGRLLGHASAKTTARYAATANAALDAAAMRASTKVRTPVRKL